jgi:hypothetical protein
MKESFWPPTLLSVAAIAVLAAACGGPSPAVREAMTRTHATVQRVERSGSYSQAGAVELQKAQEKLASARRQLDDGNEQDAVRLAVEAALDADLAQAKARSHQAQEFASELKDALEQLRRDAASGRVPATWNEYGTRTYALQTYDSSSRDDP